MNALPSRARPERAAEILRRWATAEVSPELAEHMRIFPEVADARRRRSEVIRLFHVAAQNDTIRPFLSRIDQSGYVHKDRILLRVVRYADRYRPAALPGLVDR